MAPIRVIIASGHTMFRGAIVYLLNAQKDIEVIKEVSNGREAMLAVGEARPDILLLDLVRSEMEGLAVLRHIREKSPETKALVLTDDFEEGLVLWALQEGARGYLLKSGSTVGLLKAIRVVYTGEAWVERNLMGKLLDGLPRLQQSRMAKGEKSERPTTLLTKREEEVARLVAMGYRNKEVADRLCISEKTVKTHLTSILKKLYLSNRLQLALHTLHHGFSLHQLPHD